MPQTSDDSLSARGKEAYNTARVRLPGANIESPPVSDISCNNNEDRIIMSQ